MIRKIFCFIFIVFLCGLFVVAQTREEVYQKPLKTVLDEVAVRFNTKIVYNDTLLWDKIVQYAPARISFDVEKTLYKVLGPFDLRFEKNGDTYEIKKFEYSNVSVQEGKEHLDLLLSSYNNSIDWEKRKVEIKSNILKKSGLSPMPQKTPLNPETKDKRVYKDYSVENVRIEVMPGVYMCGSLYKPTKIKGTAPAIICPHGHFPGPKVEEFDFTEHGRFRTDMQVRCAVLARLGCIVFNYSMFAQGEMSYQIPYSEHAIPFALTMQLLTSIRVLDYISSLKDVDINRIGITGASGGGTQTFNLAAVDDRITLSVPAVMVSSYMPGGCPCETGMPIHYLDAGFNTCTPEIAAMTAPRPQLLISDGTDWTQHNPVIEVPYLKTIYSIAGKPENVEHVHLPYDLHDYGKNKRLPMYRFIAKHFNLNIKSIEDSNGNIDESCTIEPYQKMLFINSSAQLPTNALRTVDDMKKQLKALQ